MSGPKLVTTSTPSNPNVHDLELDDAGQIVWLEGDISDIERYAELVAQRLKCRWSMLRGEWYLDQRIGTPWLQSLLRKGVDVATIKRVFRAVAASTPGVRSVTRLEVSMDRVNRSAEVTYELVTESGKTVTSDQLAAPFIINIPEVRHG